MTKALDQMLVLDLTPFEAGPAGTELLAFLGADVIKIEPPEWGDRGRDIARDRPDEDGSDFMRFNANKKSITLNLKSERGRGMFLQMVEQADVVIEHAAPGVLEGLGLAYEVLKEVNPMIIYATIKGVGTDCPYSEDKSFDRVAQADEGAFSVTGSAARLPLTPGPIIGDTGAGSYTATGILAAYIDRMTHGRGQKVEVLNDPHLYHRGRVVDIDHPKAGKVAMPACPVQLSESPVEVTPAPLLGQDNAAVYKHLLGLSEDDLQKLNAAGDV